MKRIRILALLTTLVLLLVCLPVSTATAAPSDSAFAGVRSVSFTVDKSDLNNFVNGGRAAFDLALRKASPAWLTYGCRSDGYDLVVTLSFAFGSLDEYEARLSTLLGQDASVVYSDADGVFLLESHTTTALLGFIQPHIPLVNNASAPQFDTFFHITEDILTLNETAYPVNGKVDIRPVGEEVIVLNYLTVDTTVDENGLFTRTLSAFPHNDEERELLEERFAAVGEVTTHDSYYGSQPIEVVFTASSDAQLAKLTTSCLRSADIILENEVTLDSLKMKVQRTEFFDLEELMTENSRFHFTFTPAPYYSNLAPVDDYTTWDDEVVASYDGDIVFSYERGFRFDAVNVETDLTDSFGKMRRVITLSTLAATAEPHHEAIKQGLTKKLSDGTAFTIEDVDGVRRYTLAFEAWFSSDVDEFTKAILGDDIDSDFSESFFPYGSSSITERFGASPIVDGMAPTQNLTATYRFASSASVEGELSNGGTVTVKDTVLTAALGSDVTVTVEYHRLHWLRTIVLLVFLLLLVPFVILGVRKLKVWWRGYKETLPEKRAAKEAARAAAREAAEQAAAEAARAAEEAARAAEEAARQAALTQPPAPPAPPMPNSSFAPPPAPSAPATPAVKYCPDCGTDNPYDGRFCRGCGKAL